MPFETAFLIRNISETVGVCRLVCHLCGPLGQVCGGPGAVGQLLALLPGIDSGCRWEQGWELTSPNVRSVGNEVPVAIGDHAAVTWSACAGGAPEWEHWQLRLVGRP